MLDHEGYCVGDVCRIQGYCDHPPHEGCKFEHRPRERGDE